jgi:hypothetical protein
VTEVEAPARGSMAFKITIRILLALTVGVSVFAVKAYLFGDHARSAQAGDCINGPGREVTDEVVTRAKKVKCLSSDAQYIVAGRVNGVTDIDSPECDKFFAAGEKFTVYSSTGDGGYLLCLRPK